MRFKPWLPVHHRHANLSENATRGEERVSKCLRALALPKDMDDLAERAQLNGPGTTGLSYRADTNSRKVLIFPLHMCALLNSLLSNCTMLSVHAAGRRDTRVH